MEKSQIFAPGDAKCLAALDGACTFAGLMESGLLDLSPLLACRKLEAVSVDRESASSVSFPGDVKVNVESYVRIYSRRQ